MKNRLPLFFVCVLLLYSVYPLFQSGVWTSHDGQGQITRIALYTKEILGGQSLVRWSGMSNYSFGSPLFIFYYPLPYYLGFVVHLFGLSFETIFKLLMGVFFLISFGSFYLWMSQLVSKKYAVMASCIYVFGTYHILEMYVRGDIGELLAFAILPLLFFSIERSIVKQMYLWIIIGGIEYGFFILSHNGISLMFPPVILLYMLLRGWQKKKTLLFSNFLLFLIGLFLSAFFWIPALYEQKYILSMALFDRMYRTRFPSLQSLFFSSWGFGSDVNKAGGLSIQIGAVEWFSFIVAVFLLIKKKTKQKSLLLFGIGIFILGIFLALPFSSTLFQHSMLLRKFQFPWRFLAYPYVLSSFLTGIVLEGVQKKWITVLFIAAVTCLLPFVKVQGYVNHPDTFYLNSQDFTFYHGEAISRWTAGNKGEYPKSPFELIAGKGKIQEKQKGSTKHMFFVNALTPISILDNTIYFPGWSVLVDGKKIPIQFQDINHRGLITFEVDKGIHNVVVIFQETADRMISNCISALTLLAIAGYFGVLFIKERKK